MSQQLLLIRARQIKALYQRELTGLHRNPHLTDAARKEQIRALWQHTVDGLEQIRANLGPDAGAAVDDVEILAPPPRPPELDDG